MFRAIPERWAWLSVAVALVGALVAAHWHLRAVAGEVEVPPDQEDALVAWLEARAPAANVPARGAGRWSGISGQPALALWAGLRLPSERLSPAVARGLAVHSVPERVLLALAPQAGMQTESLAVVLNPSLAERVAEACPALDRELASVVCGAAALRRAETGRDRALSGALLGEDEELALWAVELAAGLGSAGARLADAVLAAPSGSTSDAARARALIVLARTLPTLAARERLETFLVTDDPLAPVAALELGRLPDAVSALDAFASTTKDPALAALAQVARERASGTAPVSEPAGLLSGGL